MMGHGIQIPMWAFIIALVLQGGVLLWAMIRIINNNKKELELKDKICAEQILRNTRKLYDVSANMAEFTDQFPPLIEFTKQLKSLNHELFCAMLDIETQDLLSSKK
jgi:hypothetical protein